MRNEDGIHVSYSLDEKGEDYLDEIIANGCELVHLEQMDKNAYYIGFYHEEKNEIVQVWFTVQKDGMLNVIHEKNKWKE